MRLELFRFFWLLNLYFNFGLSLEFEEEDVDRIYDDNIRGFPLFYASFEDTGISIIDHQIAPLEEADKNMTEYLRHCKSDAYLLIRDSAPFEIGQMAKVKRLGEQSWTKASLLTDYPLNLHELALDIEEHCEAKYVDVNKYNESPVETYTDAQQRVFYLEFRPGDNELDKDEILANTLGKIPTPYVTVIYVSSYAQQNPILRSIKMDKRRKRWIGHHGHSSEKLQPVIAPLYDKMGLKSRGHSAPEIPIDLPDNFILTLLLGSVGLAIFLAYRDHIRH